MPEFSVDKRGGFISALERLFRTYFPLKSRGGISFIAIGMRATLPYRKLGFLRILKKCLQLSHLLLFNLRDFIRFVKVITLTNVKYLVWHHPEIVLYSLSDSYLALSLNAKSRLAILLNLVALSTALAAQIAFTGQLVPQQLSQHALSTALAAQIAFTGLLAVK